MSLGAQTIQALICLVMTIIESRRHYVQSERKKTFLHQLKTCEKFRDATLIFSLNCFLLIKLGHVFLYQEMATTTTAAVIHYCLQ